jgi:hypothetical protein
VVVPRHADDPSRFNELAGEIAPQFEIAEQRPGRLDVAIVGEHAGRAGVLRTAPRQAGGSCVLVRSAKLPEGKRSRLVLDVSHDAGGAWQLNVQVDGHVALAETTIGDGQSEPGWTTLSVDLTDAVKRGNPDPGLPTRIKLTQSSPANRRSAAYWGRAEIISE